MLLDSGHIKCDNCGRFISHDDLLNHKALHIMTFPDSEFTKETFESECPKCMNDRYWDIVTDITKELRAKSTE